VANHAPHRRKYGLDPHQAQASTQTKRKLIWPTPLGIGLFSPVSFGTGAVSLAFFTAHLFLAHWHGVNQSKNVF
jgi:hypothetical protein